MKEEAAKINMSDAAEINDTKEEAAKILRRKKENIEYLFYLLITLSEKEKDLLDVFIKTLDKDNSKNLIIKTLDKDNSKNLIEAIKEEIDDVKKDTCIQLQKFFEENDLSKKTVDDIYSSLFMNAVLYKQKFSIKKNDKIYYLNDIIKDLIRQTISDENTIELNKGKLPQSNLQSTMSFEKNKKTISVLKEKNSDAENSPACSLCSIY